MSDIDTPSIIYDVPIFAGFHLAYSAHHSYIHPYLRPKWNNLLRRRWPRPQEKKIEWASRECDGHLIWNALCQPPLAYAQSPILMRFHVARDATSLCGRRSAWSGHATDAQAENHNNKIALASLLANELVV